MRILLAEDDPILRELLVELLSRWGHDAVVASDGAQAVARVLEEDPFDVAILDWMMPGVSGPDVCKAIRESYSERRPFVLMLTARSELGDVVHGLDAGADEYLTKPYRPTELAARLRVAERIMKMQDALIEARRTVEYQSTHDLATGVLHRAAFLDALHQVLMARRGHEAPLSLVRVDAGGKSEARRLRLDDDLLRAVARRVTASTPDDGFIGRFSDTELLVLLPRADEDAAQDFASTLSAGFGSLPLMTAVGPVLVNVDVCFVTAATSAELDLSWLLCALDTLSVIAMPATSAHVEPRQPS